MIILELQTEDFQDLMIWLNFIWTKTKHTEEFTNIEKKRLTRLINEIRSQVAYPRPPQRTYEAS